MHKEQYICIFSKYFLITIYWIFHKFGPVGLDGKRLKTLLLPSTYLFCMFYKRFLKILSNEFKIILELFETIQVTILDKLRKLHTSYLPGVTKCSSDQYFEKKMFLKNFIDPVFEKFIDPFHEKLLSFQGIFHKFF